MWSLRLSWERQIEAHGVLRVEMNLPYLVLNQFV